MLAPVLAALAAAFSQPTSSSAPVQATQNRGGHEPAILHLSRLDAAWQQPEPVPGPFVNTPGWEDGVSVSRDGQWMVLRYSPMSQSAFRSHSLAHPLSRRAVGPWTAPARPGFPAARIARDGSFLNNQPLLGENQMPIPVPSTAFYLFERGADGEWGVPRVIGMDDGGAGVLAASGPGIATGPDGRRWLVFSFDDPTTRVADDTGADIWVAPFEPTGQTVLGRFARAEQGGVESSDLMAYPLSTDKAGHQSNPHLHLHADGSASLWVDDEGRTGDLFVCTLPAGQFPAGAWSAWKRLPRPVCLPGRGDTDESQPFFDGSRLFYRRGSSLYQTTYRGGDFALASNWTEPTVLARGTPGGTAGSVVSLSDPTVTVIDSRQWLYFGYQQVNPDGSVDTGIARAMGPEGGLPEELPSPVRPLPSTEPAQPEPTVEPAGDAGQHAGDPEPEPAIDPSGAETGR